MAFFYSGAWAVHRAPGYTDAINWSLPSEDQHFIETSAPEDLMVNPEDIDIFPAQAQAGMDYWVDQTSMEEGWYIFGSATPFDESWYVNNQDVPAESWYILQGF